MNYETKSKYENITGTASGLSITWSGQGQIVIPGGPPQGMVCRYMPAFAKFVLAFREQI